MMQPDTTSLRKNITFSIVMAMLLLIIITGTVSTLIQKYRQDQRVQKYEELIHQNIESTIKHHLENYKNRIERFINTTGLPELLKEKDREGLERILRPKWKMMKQQETYLTAMQLNLSDGSSFLRMHKPESFGDQLTPVRPMLQEIQRTHQKISGYEVGKYAAVYRTIVPIFDAEETYLGSLEMGLDPNFILHAIYETNSFPGLIFIKDEDMKLPAKPNDLIINGYRLQSKFTKDMEPIRNILASVKDLKNGTQIAVGEKRYLIHVFILHDFSHQAKVKILFFQDITKTGVLSGYMMFGVSIMIVLVLMLLALYIYRRIGSYQEEVTQIYRKQMEQLAKSAKELQLSQSYLQGIFDSSPNIMIITDGDMISNATPSMLTFFDYDTLDAFNKEHDCICDFFLENIDDEECLQRDMQGMNWLEYMYEHPSRIHKVCMMYSGSLHHFIVQAKVMEVDAHDHSVVTFIDITEQKNLESELRASKQQFDLFMLNVPYMVTIKDESYRTVYCNPATDIFLNKQVIGTTAIENLAEKTGEQVYALCDRAIRNGKAETLIMHTQNSQSYIFRALAFAIPQNDGKVYIGVIYIDISKQYQDEYKITKLKQVLENSPISIVITDIDGNIEYVNPWFCNVTGYNKKEAIGKNPKIFLSDDTSRNEYQKLWDKISKGHVWSGTYKTLKKNGEAYWESAIIAPVTDENGKIVNYIGIKQEITEQVRLKKELAAQKVKTDALGTILEESLNEIYIFGKKSLKFLYANKGAQKNIGYSLEELLEMTPVDIKQSMTANTFRGKLKKINGEDVLKIFFSTYHQRKDGTSYPVDVALQEIVYEGLNAYMAIIVDTTEREAMRKEMRKQEKVMIAQSRHAEMGEMIGMIAHQWRQPISVIAMGANNMLVDIELEEVKVESFKEQAKNILTQTDYLSKTIEDFRSFFLPHKGKKEFQLEDVMAETETIIGKILEHANITLSIRNENRYKVKTYYRELLQVLINLLKNAKEALIANREKDRHIDVMISNDEDMVIIIICDNGGGIDEAIISKIFDPYFSTKDKNIGTGLGLYMSKTIIEKHMNGRIEASNTKEGACFKIAIPLMKEKK